MSDTPELEPGQNLPATRPPVTPAPVERFTATPTVHKVELSPERAAQIVRQSSNARWIGFLAVVIVILFVSLYWFYELGFPLGLSEPRLNQEIAAQQVTKVERGYNIFQANCARCHGVNGEGGIGPVLNRQDKLFAHLNENYLRNVLTAGGRYVCGNPDSLMPVWSDQANPPGPLNYRAIDELVAYLRATNEEEYIVRHPEFFTPEKDPVTGEVETFTGWRDPNWTPEPGATPFPACYLDEFTNPSAAPSASGSGDASAEPSGDASAEPSGDASAAPSASAGAGGTVVGITALGTQFTTTAVTAPAGAPFTIQFDNQDPGMVHNVAILDGSGAEIFRGDIFPGVATKDYAVGALTAGTYKFVCSVHLNMTGSLTAQ